MKLLIGLLIVASASFSWGAIRVVTSTTDLAWMVKQVGGENVDVQALLRGTENPHYVDTIPDFVRKVADASVVCVVGLDLEVGWMPKVLARSGNAKVQPGGAGYCDTGKRIAVLDKPTGPVDRSMGDVHPEGNPHFWLSPLALAEASTAAVKSLSDSDPAHRAAYEENSKKFNAQMKALYESEKKLLAPIVSKATGPLVLEYHKEFTYLLNAYGIKSMGSLEEKPGVAPSAGRIAEMALNAKKSGVRLLLAADYSPRKTVEKFAELSGIKVLRVPTSLSADSLDYIKFRAKLMDEIVKALAVDGKAE